METVYRTGQDFAFVLDMSDVSIPDQECNSEFDDENHPFTVCPSTGAVVVCLTGDAHHLEAMSFLRAAC